MCSSSDEEEDHEMQLKKPVIGFRVDFFPTVFKVKNELFCSI